MKELALDASHLTVRSNLKNQLNQLRALYTMVLNGRKCPREFIKDHWLIAGFIQLERQPLGVEYLELTQKLELILASTSKKCDVSDLLTQMENKLKEIIYLA
ncbi:hypothetical protein [Bdellovibrio reynosensis]|uniref:Uncharacterized protein n=1 Tax=Bdellovibrio reynosensis TaxID=2835041 RepID=A0ABY4CAD8_9BACT|nr:hypothetical protein [Bdellovibrio reynosensis]UOF01887.1 hypothetical protein MNR06_02825 [Bdellovibrio reynosensis]